MVKKFSCLLIILLVVFITGACDDKENDNANGDQVNIPSDNGEDNNNDDEDEDIIILSGWYLIESYFSTPDQLSYTGGTIHGEQIITILTFPEETEGNLLLQIHSRYDGVHGNSTIFFGEGRYLWESPEPYVAVGGRAHLTMSVHPLNPGMNLKIFGYHSWPYTGPIEDVIITWALGNNPGDVYAYYIEGTTPETIMTRVFPQGNANEKISIRIDFFNGSMGDIYWFYTYQWVEGNASDEE